MNINLLRYDSALNNGINRYSETLYKGMVNVYGSQNKISEYRIRKLEPYGHFGLISTRFFSKLAASHLGEGQINHATAAFLDNKKVNVITLHDVSFIEHPKDYDERYFRYNSNFLQNLFSQGKKTIVPSKVVRDMVIRNFKVNEDRIIAVHHGFDDLPDTYINSLENPFTDDKKHIVIFGGLDNIRRKFNLILDRLQNTEYIVYVIGYGKNPIYQKYRSISNIKFMGYQEDNVVHSYIKYSDLVAYHSIDEGFGRIPIEVFMLGGKILLNDIPIFREICGDLAFYYKNDFSDFQEMLDMAISKPRINNIGFVRKNYSIEKMVRETMNVYLSTT